MKIAFCNGNNKEYEQMLNNLLREVFFDFQFWFDLGLWDENYESYSFMENGLILSNVCVYKAQILLKGQRHVNMFHLHLGDLKNCLYEIPELRTMVVARQAGSTLGLIGVFSLEDISFLELANHLPFSGVERIEFGFIPPWFDVSFVFEERDSIPLFVRGFLRAGGF